MSFEIRPFDSLFSSITISTPVFSSPGISIMGVPSPRDESEHRAGQRRYEQVQLAPPYPIHPYAQTSYTYIPGYGFYPGVFQCVPQPGFNIHVTY
jgi:hypothetical protein